ncbi:MAG TPA: GAF domain-containing protein [Anaerolineales bacterium]|nr:GAF domain-containing protein [Anaerolineales bacterium]
MRRNLLKLRYLSLKDRLASLLHRSPELVGRDNVGAIIGLLLLILGFSLLSGSFRQVSNLVLLAKSAAITIGIVAVGQTVVMISGGIDLSVSSVIAITGLVTACLMKFGLGPIPPMEGNWCYLAIAIGWLVGLLIGAGQGFLITRYQMPAFIVTLGTMVGLRGLSVAISNSAPINALPDEFKWFSDGRVGIIPAPVLILLVVYLSTAYMLRNTKMGRYCHAIGGNETAARLAGIAVDRYRIYFYAYSGLLAALTGTILISYIDAAVYTNGDGFQFNSVAAAIIGGTSLIGGIGGIWGTLTGVLILATIPSGMVMLNVPSWWRDVVTGIVILLAVFIDVNRQHARKNAIRVDTIQTMPGGHYLYKLLNELFYRIKKYTGTSLCRVYLVYRETGDLVAQDTLTLEKNPPPLSALPGKSRIVLEAKESGSAVLIQDLARSGYQSVVPIQPDVQCALALPLIHNDHCIGVIELQSPGVAAFKDSTVETLRAISFPSLAAIEDAWLFESGWLVRQVRDALRHLWDDLYLGRMDLSSWALSAQNLHRDRAVGMRGEALRDLLIQTIERLKTHDTHDEAHGTRCYRVLQLTYIQEQAVDQIVRATHISRRQYFYDLKDSIEILSDMLIRDRYQASIQNAPVAEMADRLSQYSP